MNRKWVSDTICVGLELEYEGVPSELVASIYREKYLQRLLVFCNDGSLRPRRANTEVKFAGPLAGPLIDDALDHIKTMLTWHEHRISWRCGMHVHVDCRGTDFLQAYRAAILSALIEPVLYAWDGTGRHENKFCQSIVDSVYAYCRPGSMPILTKYALVNLKSLFELGTLELRFAGSTKNLERIAAFINIGMGLRDVISRFKSGSDLITSVLEAPTLEHWLDRHTHPLMAEQLIPVIRKHAIHAPTPAALGAALELLGPERVMRQDHRLIGGNN